MVASTRQSVCMGAPAKLNFHLSIGPRRSDGYHDLISIFQMIDLCDTVQITRTPGSRFSVSVVMENFESIEENTMEKAARLFADVTGIADALSIRCKKRIPMQAGLGGGSSDAAAVLLLLSKLYGYPLQRSELIAIGAKVGSDVPFFLGDSTAACVEGRGEVLTALEARTDLYGVLIMPEGVGVSTREAFGELDRARLQNKVPLRTIGKGQLVSMYAQPVAEWRYFNDFRAVMGPLSPLYDTLDTIVSELPDAFGTVSGSGAAYCIVSAEHRISELFRTKVERIGANVTIFDIKSLHRADSGVTVSL